MGKVQRRQIKGIIRAQKRAIRCARTNMERAEAFGIWGGFLTGLRMTGAITKEEYEELYFEMTEFNKVA